MDRTLLFKGKRISDGKWIVGHYYIMNTQLGNKYYIIPLNSNDGPIGEEIDNITLSQYTNVLDVNSNMIFENDIVTITTTTSSITHKVDHTNTGQVIFRDGAFGVLYKVVSEKPTFHPLYKINEISQNGSLYSYLMYSFEVISNKYDDREEPNAHYRYDKLFETAVINAEKDENSSFQKGVKWLLQQPVSMRLTDDEKRALGWYYNFRYWGCDVLQNQDYMTGYNQGRLSGIFGGELFKEIQEQFSNEEED